MVSQYDIYFYLGVFFFVLHIWLYGFGIDLSFFGLLLMYIGWKKPVLSYWFSTILLVFIGLELWSNFNAVYQRIQLWMEPVKPKTEKPREKK